MYFSDCFSTGLICRWVNRNLTIELVLKMNFLRIIFDFRKNFQYLINLPIFNKSFNFLNFRFSNKFSIFEINFAICQIFFSILGNQMLSSMKIKKNRNLEKFSRWHNYYREILVLTQEN